MSSLEGKQEKQEFLFSILQNPNSSCPALKPRFGSMKIGFSSKFWYYRSLPCPSWTQKTYTNHPAITRNHQKSPCAHLNAQVIWPPAPKASLVIRQPFHQRWPGISFSFAPASRFEGFRVSRRPPDASQSSNFQFF